MNVERYRELTTKLGENSITQREMTELETIIESLSEEELMAMGAGSVDEKIGQLSDEKYFSLIHNAKQKAFKKKSNAPVKRILYSVSVAASLLVCVFVYKTMHRTSEIMETNNDKIASSITSNTINPKNITQSVLQKTLLDGTKVVMKPGSKIWYESDFNKENRIVRIEGDVYFDVVHNDKKPFIIHSGDLTTTVLGTAFEIKYWKKDKAASVMVTRGLVKVQKGEKNLALLHKDEILTYDNVKDSGNTAKIDATPLVTNWANKDLKFSGTDIEDILLTLSTRYNKHFIIQSDIVKRTPIVATFSYEDSIEDILKVLCTISRSNYVQSNDTITISKK
ncbi:MAG: hypothetical protein DI598_05655 [Pseudopedobacter saltans]|uniref:Anti-FecI sigma factor, FecR n=1 Tax=Pseudopedobacter saltans TaxID=151895 RepID=A0A2W5H9K7_9SPHI|nr:MAG: hypothetical protein DI598_05655 [Pseudopedobacter saltans]